MKITNGAFVRKSLAVFSAAISLIAFISCGEDTGLGSTIDTEAPKIAISYPNPKVSNVARDEFVLAGTCSDDKLISRVQVAVTNLDTQTSYGTFPATLDAKSNTWSVKLNTFDASNEDNCNGWPFPDGNYKFVATAYDNAGHSTQDTSSFEIDNTAPVVVLESPGSITTATEYGSSFYVAGTITEEHTVSSLKVTIYDEDGNVLDQTDAAPYIENDIATAGGTNVSFMKFSTGSSALKERYKEIYGDNENAGTKNYTCAIYVSDNAKEFKNPGESSNTSGGNETPVFYLYSDVYKSLMSSNGYGLSASDLMRIINGTYTASDDSSRSASGGEGGLTSEQLAEVKAILAREDQSGYDAEKSKATDTSEKHLKFSLNPKVNPTYTISGLSIDSSAGSYPSGNKGQTLTFILSPGLDGTLIEAATVKAWLLKCRSQEEGLSEEDYAEFLSDPAKFEGATKILDLSEKYDSDTMLSSLTSTFKLPEITANYFYIVAISGVDADGNELIPDGTFGFIGALSGTPPKVTIETPAKQAIIGSSADITFSGSVVTTDVELESIDISFDVTNLADGTSLTTSESAIKLVASGSGKEGDSVTWSEPEYNSSTSKYTYTWTCNLRDCDNYELFSAEKGSGKIYSYTATVKATDISGNYSEGSSMVTADTLPPVITVSSLLPSVSDYIDENHTDENVVYVNGNITISGTIYDDNLKTAYYTVLVNGETVKNEAGNDDEEFTKVTIPNTQFKINVDTTKLEDDSKFDILIYAEDRANASSSSTITTDLSGNEGEGNNTSVNVSETDLYDDGVSLRILQETDRPVISTTNADSSITDYEGIIAAVKAASALSTNIFSAGGKLNATVSDDDGIDSVIVEYSSDGSDYKELSSKYSASNNTLSAELPPSGYGEYHIRITAKDKKGLEFGSTVSEFYIAVDDGIPTFSGIQPTDGNYYNDGFTVSGSVKDASGQVSLKLKDELNGILDNAEGASGTSASVSGNSGVKTGAKFADTVKVPSESGTYTLTYIASDKYLQESEYSISYTVDKDKPILSDFAGFENGGNLGTKAPPISVKASDDLSGLAKVSVYDGNGTEIAQLSGVGSLYQGNVSLSEGKNSICVKAFDKAGNDARLPESGFFTVTVDTVAPAIESPSLSITEINAENYGSADFDGVTVTATVTDGGSGAKYAWLSTSSGETSYSESASAIKAENKNEDLTAEWNVSLLIPKAAFSDDSGARDGQYTYYLYAEDAAPKASVSSALTFVVDTTAPVVTVSNLASNAVYTENDVTNLDLTASARSAKYKVSGTWTDAVKGTSTLEYSTDGGSHWTNVTGLQSASGVTMSWNATIDVAEGSEKSIKFRATDLAGNTSDEADYTFSGITFDFSVPVITFDSYVEKTNSTFILSGTVSDVLRISSSKATITATKDGTSRDVAPSWTPVTEDKSYRFSVTVPASSANHENDGQWEFTVNASDEAGRNAAAATASSLIDTKAPEVKTPSITIEESSKDDSDITYFNQSNVIDLKIEVKDDDDEITTSGVKTVQYAISSGHTNLTYDAAKSASPSTIVADWAKLSEEEDNSWEATIKALQKAGNGEYVIFVRATDFAGNTADSSVIKLLADNISPVISETDNIDKYIAVDDDNKFELSGTVSDTYLIAVTSSATVGNDSDRAAEVEWIKAENKWKISQAIENDDSSHSFTYAITAKDLAGNTTTHNKTVYVDRESPTVAISTLNKADAATNTFVNSANCTFAGSSSDDLSGISSLTGYLLTATAATTINESSGEEAVKAKALLSSAIAVGSGVNAAASWNTTFTIESDGSYVPVFVATDVAGNTSVTIGSQFTADFAAPKSTLALSNVYELGTSSSAELTGDNYGDGATSSKWTDGITYYANESFTLSGTVSDIAFSSDKITLTVNNESQILTKTTTGDSLTSMGWSYAQTVSSDTTYTYKLTLEDNSGNKITKTFIVQYDKSAPSVSILAPASGSNQTDDTISISGTVNDGAGIGAGFVTYAIYKENTERELIATETITIDGGSWRKIVSELPENATGKLILVATAADYLGNSADSSERSFYRDSTAPKISSPSMKTADEFASEITNDGWYNSSSIALSATASDNESGVSSVTYKVKNGSTVGSETALTLSGGNANGKVVLSEGTNTITITATNNVALSATENLTVHIDTTKPVFNGTKLYKTSDSTDKTAVSVSNEDVTIAGTLTEENLAERPLSVTATKDGSEADISSITITQPASNGSAWTVAVPASSTNHENDGQWVFTVTAIDRAGNTSSTTATVRIDTTKPVLSTPVVETSSTTKGSGDSAEKWYKTTELRITGTTTENGSGLSSVSYQTSEDGTTWSNAINFDGTSSWDKTISGFKSGTTRVKITALDKAGNEADAVTAGPFNIDTKAPELTAGSVKVGGKEVSESSPYYSNGKADAVITFSVTDSAAGSGVEKVYVVPYESVSDETAVNANKATLNAGTASIEITKEKFTKSGTMYARIYDYAGNYADVNLFALTYDATDPKIQSYALSDNTSRFTAYNSGKDSAGNAVYYVNNGDSHTFTLSGIATDNLGLSSAVLSINGTKVKEITNEDSLSSYSFGSIDLSSYSGDAAAKITLTDKAGNTAEQAFTIKLDTAAPQGSHDTDSANQDYIFRIGSGTGGKYSAGTYGNASTIQIRGYFNETGSGTNMIYYKLFSGSKPTAADATTFLSSYESSATGYFSPLSSEESAEVSSSVDSTTKTVKTNFKSNISGFKEGNNYLLLVAVDNVGNADLDNVTYEYTDESSQSVSVKGCYSINVDTTTPVFDKESESILTNGEGEGGNANIVIEGYVTDAAAGIDSVAVSVTVGTSTASATVETEAAATADDANRIKWTATLAKSAFSSVTSGTYTVYAKATDKAGEGNSQTVAVANVTVDKIAPTVTLTNPSDADSSTTEREINGTISLSGTITDANTLPDIAISGIEYSTDNSSWNDLASVEGMNLTLTGNYTFTVSGFDTTKLADETSYYIRAVAVDKAGNTGYSEAKLVKVSQNTDRPVIKITNLNVQGSEYILKYGKDSQITATVTDDDGISTVVLSESPYDGTGTEPTTSVWTPNNETVTFTPADTADGTKTFYVYVKDSKEKVFYTTYDTSNGTNYLNIPKISVANEDIGNEKEAAVFTYVSDSTSPVVGTVEGLAYKSDGTTVNGGYNSETASYTVYETVGASYVVGGSERQKVKFQISASDANGIAGMTAELSYKDSDGKDVSKKIRTSSLTDSAYSAYTANGSLEISSEDSTSATWTTTDLISLADAATGSITLTVTPYDKSGLVGNGTFTFVADQSGPTVKVTSPSSTEHVSGSSILVSGIATDVGGSSTSTIQWGIPNASGEIENWQGELTSTSGVSAWSFNFDGSSNASFGEFTDKTKYKVSESSDIWTIPVYFKASDLLGNETVYKGFSLLYDPDADRPQTTLSYPGEADKKSGENYAILGGTIRATGSVEIPDGSTSVWAVYMQISDDNGEFSTTDKTRASNAKSDSGYGYEVVDAAAMEVNWQTANSNTGSLNFHSTDSSKDSSYRSSWWGIKVTKNSGSWYVNLNSSGELNSNVAGSTNNIKVRFCGVSSEGKVGHWTEPYSIHIDSNVPKYTTAMYKYSGDITSVSNLYTEGTYTDSDSGIVTASKITTYEADMYLKGQWYAFAKITDESSVKITGVKRGTTSLTYGSDYFVYPESAGKDGESSTGSDLRVDGSNSSASSDSSASYVAYVWVKIDPAYTTTQTYTITAKDSDGTPNTIYPAFELNTDNTAPTVTALTDTSGSAISMTKLRNSDHGITFETSATDTGSGFDKLLFYFKRTITSNSTATTTIELPLPGGTSGNWTTGSDAAYVGTLTETDSDLDEENELYGVTLSGTSSSDGSTTTFTSSSDISSYKFIRKGGVIKLSGVYYVISDVSGNAITVNSAVSGSPESAFAAAAMVLDHVSTAEGWTWTNGTFKVAGDEDDDGFVEYIKKSGSTWTCEATIMGNQLEDGPISLVTVAFDKAENVTTTTTNVMIANNTPRLAKVFLATDLNGDAKFTDNEFGSSTIKNLNQTYKFYSALTNGTEGSAREVVTLSQSNDGVSTGLTIRDSLAAAFEFVSGDDYEGYGSGNGDLYYKLDVGTSALTEAQAGSVSATDGKKLTKLESMSDKFASVSDIEIGSTAVSAKALTGLVITPANITSRTYGTHAECTDSEQTVSYIGLTLWDSTKGTTPGVGDTVSGGKIKAFGSQSTVVNIPLYIDLTDDVDPNPTFADPTAHTDGGHVELSSTLPSGKFSSTGSAEYDRDTKISGKVVFTGSVSDEKRVSSIKLTSGKAINSTLTSAVEVASYDTTNGLLKVTDAASETDGWTFAINETTADEQFSVTDGHKVTWTLTLDSSYVENVAASDVLFTLTASDGTNGADATYQVDIVPYITGIVRGNKTISDGTMNRSYHGRYPVAEGETLKVSGYNLGTSGSWTVGTHNTTTLYTGTKADDGTYSFTMTVPARSGNLSVTVNNISSLNNENDNTQENNKESFKMSGTSTVYSASDNRYLSVWNLGNYFKNTLKSESKEFEYPVMTAKANGDLVASWGTPSNGSVTFSYGLAKDSTAIYNAYDQPGSYTGVAFDQKGDSGAASVMYMAELQGNGGTYSVTASASDSVVGGAVVTQIGKDDIDETHVYSGKKAVVSGNPSIYLDGDNTTGFYTLQNYDMQRRLGIYQNPQAARYGNYLHNIWYDSQNESLKYSVVNLGEENITSNYSERTAAFAGWVVIDGNYTQQDRVFEWTTNTTNSKTNNKVGGADNKAGTQTGVGSTYNPAVFSKVIFLGSNTNKDHKQTSYIGDDPTSTSLVIKGASYATAPAPGDSIALLDNTNGGYKILVSKITKVDGTTITWEDSLPDDFTIHSATIYQGDMNVVGGTYSKDGSLRNYASFYRSTENDNLKDSSSAGSSAAIDVMTNGYPVVAYYDATNSQLRVAVSSDKNPKLASNWTRYNTGKSCSGEVSMKIDGANNIHIMYNNEDGQMCYLYGTYNDGSYTWGTEEVVDENGSLSYGSISVVYDGSSYVPAMTYLNKANTANGVKYAYRTVAPAAEDASSGGWDFMIIPALGNGHYALKENKISLESSNNWKSTTATVLQNQLDTTQPKTATPATVDSVIAYKTSKAYETAYLKKE